MNQFSFREQGWKMHSERVSRGSKRKTMIGLIIGKYQLRKQIGKGTFGRTYEAKNILTKETVLAKIIHYKKHESIEHKKGRSLLSILQNQISIHSSLLHPNIPKFEDVVKTNRYICIFMEYCPKGELFDYLRSQGTLSLEVAGKVFAQILSAVTYLHENKISHRDIKAENIVFDQNMNAKLIDFGLSKKYSNNCVRERLNTFCGSPSYVCPEIIDKKVYDGEMIDVWSLGVTLYAMIEGALPFDSDSPEKTSQNIKEFKWHQTENAPPEAIELFKEIFIPSKYRIRIDEIRDSCFYQKYCQSWSPIQVEIQSEREKISINHAIQCNSPPKFDATPDEIDIKNRMRLSHRTKYHKISSHSSKKSERTERSYSSKKSQNELFRVRLTPMKRINNPENKHFQINPQPIMF